MSFLLVAGLALAGASLVVRRPRISLRLALVGLLLLAVRTLWIVRSVAG